jgi:hypothetical protein
MKKLLGDLVDGLPFVFFPLVLAIILMAATGQHATHVVWMSP